MKRHGMYGSPEFNVWSGMIQRCLNPKNTAYVNYGGRGITVCDEWRDFKRFYRDMGPRPTLEHTIERRDNNRGYEPSNCCWATRKQQLNNKRDNVVLKYKGVRQTLSQWAEALGLSRSVLSARIDRGWAVADALETKPQRHLKTDLVSFQGVRQSIAQWERHLGFASGVIRARLRRGWPIQEALTRRSDRCVRVARAK